MIKTIFESLDFNIKLWSSFIDFASFILFCFLSPVMIWFDLIDQSTVWYDLIWYDRPVYSMVWFNFVNSISLSLFLFISEERLSSLAETWFIYLFIYLFISLSYQRRWNDHRWERHQHIWRSAAANFIGQSNVFKSW